MKMILRLLSSLPPCLILSFLGHVTALGAIPHFGSYNFTGPVMAASMVEVHLGQLPAPTQRDGSGPRGIPNRPGGDKANGEGRGRGKASMPRFPSRAAVPQAGDQGKDAASEAVGAGMTGTQNAAVKTRESDLGNSGTRGGAPPAPSPAGGRNAAAYLSATRERLSYQVFLMGVPAGSAVLEATRKEADVTITWTVRSNPFAAGFFRVEDQAQTRLMGGGRYIVSRVTQQEGSFRSDTGFTLCFPEQKAFWVDRLHNRMSTQPLEGEDTTDIFFGFYYLRNRPLEVGKTVLLHLFDSNRTLEAPVEVLRRERIQLSLFKEVDTLVVRPAFNTDSFFKGTGELTIWLTDDQYRVPVRLETTLPIGSVRAELVAAEVEHPEKATASKAFDADRNLRKSDGNSD